MPQLDVKKANAHIAAMKKSASYAEWKQKLGSDAYISELACYPFQSEGSIQYLLTRAILAEVSCSDMLVPLVRDLSVQLDDWFNQTHCLDALFIALEKKLPVSFFETILPYIPQELHLILLRKAIEAEHDAAHMVFLPSIRLAELGVDDYLDIINLAIMHHDFVVLNVMLTEELLATRSDDVKKGIMVNIITAPEDDHAIFVKRLLDNGVSLENEYLSSAVRQNKRLIAACLLKNGAHPTEWDASGYSAAHYAAVGCDPLMLQLLYRNGADFRHKTRDNQSVFELVEDEKTQQILTQYCPDVEPVALFDSVNDHPAIHYLVIRGGGVKGMAYPFAIAEAEEQKLFSLPQLKGVSGASAGAITAMLIALNYDVHELEREISGIQIANYLDPIDPEYNVQEGALLRLKSHFSSGLFGGLLRTMLSSPFDIGRVRAFYKTLDEHKGVMHGNLCYAWLKERMSQKIQSLAEISDFLKQNPEFITFADLKKAGFKDLRVVATDINRGRAVFFSADLTPDAIVVDAVRASMSFPLVFKPHKYYIREHVGPGVDDYIRKVHSDYVDVDLVDGGVFENYPMRSFDQDPITKQYVYNPHVMGLYLATSEEKKAFERAVMEIPSAIGGGFPFLKALATSVGNYQEHTHFESNENERSIYINTLDIGTVDFKIPPEKIKQLAEEARRSVHDFMSRRSGQQILKPLSPDTLKLLIRLAGEHCQKVEPSRTILNLHRLMISPEKIVTLYANAKEDELERLRVLVNPNGMRDVYGNTALHMALAYQAHFEKALHSNDWSDEENEVILARLQKLRLAVSHLRQAHANEYAMNVAEKRPAEMLADDLVEPASDSFLMAQQSDSEAEFLQKFVQSEQRKFRQLALEREAERQRVIELERILNSKIPEPEVLVAQIATLSKEHESLMNEKDHLLAENATYRDENGALERVRNRLSFNFSQLNQENASLTDLNAKLMLSNEQLKQENQNLTLENKPLAASIARLKAENILFNDQLSGEVRLQQERVVWTTRLNDANQLIESQQVQIASLSQHVQQLRQQIRQQENGSFKSAFRALIAHRDCLINESNSFFSMHHDRKQAKIQAINLFINRMTDQGAHSEHSLAQIIHDCDSRRLLRAGFFSRRTATLVDKLIHAEAESFTLAIN